MNVQDDSEKLDPQISSWRADSEKAREALAAGNESRALAILGNMRRYSGYTPEWARQLFGATETHLGAFDDSTTEADSKPDYTPVHEDFFGKNTL